MRIMLVAVLAIAASARADTPQPATCKPAGGVVFEVDELLDKGTQGPTSTTKLYGNGTLVRTSVDADVVRSMSLCLDSFKVETVKKELRGARWKVTRNGITCRAYSPRYTVYKWGTRTLFTEHTCGAEAIDEASHTALTRILKTLGVSKPTRSCEEDPLACVD